MRRLLVIGGVLGLAAVIAFVAWPRRERRKTASARVSTASKIVPAHAASTASSGRRVAGLVLLGGAPAPGATVRLGDQTVASAADGSFAFDGVTPRDGIVVGAQLGDALGSVLLSSEDLRARLIIVLQRCAGTVKGRVVDVSGGPVAGARFDFPPIVSGDDGSFSFCATGPFFAARVEADGYATGRLDLSLVRGGVVTRDVILGPEATVSGVVVDKETAEPIAGALVERRQPTDASGRFELHHLAPGRVRLRAEAAGYGDAVEDAEVAVGDAKPITIRLAPGATVHGYVLDGEAPVVGAAIELSRPGYPPTTEASATTSATGEFTLVSSGAVVLAMADYTVDTGPLELRRAPVELVVHATPKAIARGHVLQDGKPVAGATVETIKAKSRATATSDATGAYELRGLECPCVLEADSADHTAFGTVELAPGLREVKDGVDIALGFDASIAGVVVDQDGAPVAGAFVRFDLLGGADQGRDATAADGTFRAGGLRGGGDYGIEIDEDQELPPASSGSFPPVHVADAHTHVTDQRFVVENRRLPSSGTVRTRQGAPVPDVLVWTEDPSAASARTDQDGVFRFPPLVAGSYTAVLQSHGSLIERKFAAGDEDIAIVLSATGRVHGRVTGFREQPEVRCVCEGPIPVDVSADGTFAVADVPVGRCLVTARSEGEQASEDVTVVEGQTVEVTLASAGTARVNVHLREVGTGDPLEFVQCRSSLTDANGDATIDVPAHHDVQYLCVPTREAWVCPPSSLDLEPGTTTDVQLGWFPLADRRETRSLWLDGQMVKQAPAPLAAGDQIVALDGIPLASAGDCGIWMLRLKPGLAVSLIRAGAPMELALP
jgi:hypothetical protein